MKKYSEFINFPIYIWASKEVDVDVPADEDDSSDEEEKCTFNVPDCLNFGLGYHDAILIFIHQLIRNCSCFFTFLYVLHCYKQLK